MSTVCNVDAIPVLPWFLPKTVQILLLHERILTFSRDLICCQWTENTLLELEGIKFVVSDNEWLMVCLSRCNPSVALVFGKNQKSSISMREVWHLDYGLICCQWTAHSVNVIVVVVYGKIKSIHKRESSPQSECESLLVGMTHTIRQPLANYQAGSTSAQYPQYGIV